jgi:hypothetical protein
MSSRAELACFRLLLIALAVSLAFVIGECAARQHLSAPSDLPHDERNLMYEYDASRT